MKTGRGSARYPRRFRGSAKRRRLIEKKTTHPRYENNRVAPAIPIDRAVKTLPREAGVGERSAEAGIPEKRLVCFSSSRIHRPGKKSTERELASRKRRRRAALNRKSATRAVRARPRKRFHPAVGRGIRTSESSFVFLFLFDFIYLFFLFFFPFLRLESSGFLGRARKLFVKRVKDASFRRAVNNYVYRSLFLRCRV